VTRVASDPSGPKAFSVRAVEQELANPWRAGDHDVAGSGESASGGTPTAASVRACMSNLLVLCRSEAEASRAMVDLPEVLAVHPARALVLVAQPGPGPARLEAYVAAHCHVREGTQVCGESVTITAHGSAADRLPATARALLVGDLPSALWWATAAAPASDDALFAELRDMVSLVVVDSREWRDVPGGFAALGALTGSPRGPALVELGWHRLRPWRQLLAQALDPGAAPDGLAHLTEVSIGHGPDAAVEARLLVGWLAGRLGWRLASAAEDRAGGIGWRFVTDGRTILAATQRLGPSGLRQVVITAGAEAPHARIGIEAPGDRQLALAGPGGARVVTPTAESRAPLVARLLSEPTPDPLFGEALASARGLPERSLFTPTPLG
jgi:glucose-6-phosphate dehydrogenase assembly protein OpcA